MYNEQIDVLSNLIRAEPHHELNSIYFCFHFFSELIYNSRCLYFSLFV